MILPSESEGGRWSGRHSAVSSRTAALTSELGGGGRRGQEVQDAWFPAGGRGQEVPGE